MKSRTKEVKDAFFGEERPFKQYDNLHPPSPTGVLRHSSDNEKQQLEPQYYAYYHNVVDTHLIN